MAQSISLSKGQVTGHWQLKLSLQIGLYIILLLLWDVQARAGVLPQFLHSVGFYTVLSHFWEIPALPRLLVVLAFYALLLFGWESLVRNGVRPSLFRSLGFFTILLLLWDGLARSGIWPPFLFVGPIDVVQSLSDNVQNGVLFTAILVSVTRLAVGYFISAILGVSLGLLIGLSRSAKETLGSLVLGFQALPSVCWIPLAILWFGLSENAMYFVVIMGALFSVVVGVEAGVRNTPPVYIKAARNMGASGLNLALRVVLPAALPSVMVGLKQGWTYAWRSLMAAELIYVTVSLGGLLEESRTNLEIPQMFSVMVVIIIVGVLIDTLIFAPLDRTIRLRWGFEK